MNTGNTSTITTDVHGERGRAARRTNAARTPVALDNPQVARRLRDMPVNYQKTYKKAMQGKGLRAAVKAQCCECVNWKRDEVTACTDQGCPLYPYRPYQEAKL